MKKLLFLNGVLILLSLIQFFHSCSPNPLENEQKEFDPFYSKSVLRSLPLEDQKQAWIARLKSYQNLDLSVPQKAILENMISDLQEMESGKFFLAESLRNNAASLAKIMPQVDFVNLFCEVSSAIPTLQKSGPVCSDYVINEIRTDVGPAPKSEMQVTYRTPLCDCNWTCNQQLDNCLYGGELLSACSGGATTGCCTPAPGCGLFGLGTCTGKVECAGE
ncbi:MAG TPA: hypothetical protein DCF33_03205 [Saprospirales bacterium]|nr:hypothetical protein [Saprospirales bacterium]